MPDPYSYGEDIVFNLEFRDAGGTLSEPDSVQITAKQPDGTVVDVSADWDGTPGKWTVHAPSLQVGWFVLRVVTSGTPALADEYAYEVVEAFTETGINPANPPIATPDELGTFLKNRSIDTGTAELLLQLAQDLCASVVSPVPAAAKGIVLGVAARAYTNPQAMQGESVGPYSTQFVAGSGGMYLTRTDVATLRRFAGRGGVFTVDPTPADAGTSLPPWSQNITWLNGVPMLTDQETS